MFCKYCGNQVPDGTRFCTRCGKALAKEAVGAQPEPVPAPQPEPVPAPKPEPVPMPQPEPVPAPVNAGEGEPAARRGGEKVPAKKSSRATKIIILCAALLVVLGGGGFAGWYFLSQNAYNEELEAGDAYLDDGDYEDAVEAYRAALKKKSGDVRATLGLAGAYLREGSYETAEEVLSGLKISDADPRYEEYETLLTSARDAIVYGQEMEEGDASMKKEDYKKAVSAYREALERRSGDVPAALGLARAYLHSGSQDKAEEALSGLKMSKSDPRYEEYNELLALSRLRLEIEDVDTSAFPTVTVALGSMGDLPLSPEQFVLLEDGAAREIASVERVPGGAYLTFLAEDTDGSDEARELDLSFTAEKLAFRAGGGYTTPHIEPARLTLVSSDVSAYPLVRLYFRAETPDGETIPGLGKNSFVIRERLQGGEYLSREVHSVLPLEGNAGLNIDLVADKSDSISAGDMGKIKNVMRQFVNSLHYEVGDRAEVLAFDSVVQQMCSYTDDPALLVNGINNMSTDGMTAFYDAIYDGVTHAALQGGARCVIAFTDGIDNRSRRSVDEVIDYAGAKQVPVYIVGVGGSVEERTLRGIADSTGGRYWYIDDLYDLEQIFSEIYTKQKELYVVEYESDGDADRYAAREVDVSVSGGGYRADVRNMKFTPSRSIKDPGVTHTSRYQIVRENLTWEEASQRCQEMGGHLATITSQAEMDELIRMAEDAGAKYIWLGGTTSHDEHGNVFGHWVTGEEFDFQIWTAGEPSRLDLDGTEEWYIMMWYLPNYGGWSWNDQRNDPVAAVPAMEGEMAFICEFED